MITITGGKYAQTAITTAGTNTLTCSGAAFASGDFTVQRLVGMWNSVGLFLGIAFVRSYTSATVLSLETPFFDPATGSTITQTVGNIIVVSKNFTDSVTTGLTVSNTVVTLTDQVTFGNTSNIGVCFYDQGCDVVSNYAAASSGGTAMNVASGLCCFGKLENYASSTVSNPVNFYMTALWSSAGATYNINGPTGGGGSIANLLWYGGSIISGCPYPCFTGTNVGTAPYTMVFNGVQFGVSLVSPSSGGSWVNNQTRIQLLNCFSEFQLSSSCARLWGDGIQVGGSFKFPFNTSGPYGCFGNYGVGGNFFYAGAPGSRTIAIDLGSVGFLAWTGEGNPATWYVTNFIASSYNFGPGAAPSTYVMNIYFEDTFTFSSPSWLNVNTVGLNSPVKANVGPICSIISGQATIVGGNSFAANQAINFTTTVGTGANGVVAGTTYYVLSSGLNSTQFQVSTSVAGTPITFNAAGVNVALNASIANTASPALLYQVVSGTTQTTAPPAAWYWGAKAYGKQAAFGTITPSTYSTLSGNGPQVSFTTSVSMLTDTGVGSVTQTTANSYTSISTLDQLYAASSNWATLSSNNAAFPSISVYPITYSGSQLNLGSLNLVLSNSGAAFAINQSTNTITINCSSLVTGSIFTSFITSGSVTLGSSSIVVPYTSSAGTQGSITLNNLLANSQISLSNGTSVQQVYVANSGTSYTFYTPPAATSTWTWKVAAYGYISSSGTFLSNSVSISTVSLVPDTGITQSNSSIVAAYSVLANNDQLYDYAAYWQTTNNTGGIQVANPLIKSGTQILSTGTNLTLSNSATSIFAYSGTSLTAKTTTTFGSGVTFTSLGSSTTTFSNTGVQINSVYVNTVGTSCVLTISNLPSAVGTNTCLSIANNTSVQQQYITQAGTSQAIYIAPGGIGTWTWKAACYGYISQTSSFTPSGYVNQVAGLTIDTGITQSSNTIVAAYNSVANCDALYDYAAYWQTTNNTGGIQVANPLIKSGTLVQSTGVNITLGTSGSTFTYSGTTITANTSGIFASGINFTSLGSSTTSFSNTGVQITSVYVNTVGTSCVLTISNLPTTVGNNTCISIVNTAGTQQQYITQAGTSRAIYIAPLATVTSWTWKAACYGFLSQTSSFNPTGYVNQVASIGVDTGITQSSNTIVAAYTAIANCDVLYDYAAYYETTNQSGGILVSRPTLKNGSQVQLSGISLTINSAASSLWTYSGTSLTVKANVFASGITFTSIGSSTTSITLSGTSSIICVYQTSAGTSCVLTFSGQPTGASFSVANNTSVQQQFIDPGVNPEPVYISPGQIGTWNYKVAYYGDLPQTGTFTPSGYVNIAVTLQTDAGITNANSANVALYSTIGTLDQLYDYAAYWETTNNTGGIQVARPVLKNGTQVLTTGVNITLNSAASSIWTYSGSTLTIKSSTLASGNTFLSVGSSTTTFSNTGSTITSVYVNTVGTSCVFTLNNLPAGNTCLSIANNTSVQQQYVGELSSSHTFYISPQTSIASWNWKAAEYAYISQSSTFIPSGYVSQTVSLASDPGITNSNVANVALYSSISSIDQLYDYAAYWQTTNNTGGIQVSTPIVKSGTQVLSTGINLTFLTSASATYAYSGTTVTVNTTPVFNSGNTFTTIGSATTTFSNTGVLISSVYINTIGTSAVLTFTGQKSNSAISITNASNVQQQFITAANSTQSVYIAPGGTGAWNWKAAYYGQIAATGTFTPSGYIAINASQGTDTGITQSNGSIVAAYTSIANNDTLYDYAAYWETTNNTGGIQVSRPVIKNGSQVLSTGVNITLNASAGSIWAYSGSTLTVKTSSTFASGVTFTSIGSSTTTFSNTGVLISTVYVNTVGTSCVVTFTGQPAGSSLSLLNASNAQQQYIGSMITSQPVYIAPQSNTSPWLWKIADYGYISTTGTFTPVGYVPVAVGLVSDSGITNPNVANVALYSTIGTLDQFYDFAAYWQATNNPGGILSQIPIVKSGTQVLSPNTNITLNTSLSTQFAYSGNTISINTATLATGVTFTSIGSSTTIISNTGSNLTCVYQTTQGTSTVITLTGLPANSAVSISNATFVQQQFIGLSTSPQKIYVSPAAVSTWNWKVAYYGDNASSGSFSLQGYVNVIVSLGTDTGITNPNVANVALYSTLGTPDQIYDYLAYYETTNGTGGIQVARPSSKNGIQVSFGNNNVVFNSGASSIYNYAAGTPNVLTFKTPATFGIGSTFTQFGTSGSLTLTGASVTCVYTTNAGTSAVLVVTNIPANSTFFLQDSAGTQKVFQQGINTGTYSYGTAPGALAGTWTFATKAVGYTSLAGSYVPASGGTSTFAYAGQQKLQPSGSTMYTGSSSGVGSVQFTGLTEADIYIGNGQLTVQQAQDLTEVALTTTANGMQWLAGGLGEVTEYIAPTGNYLFMTHNWRLKALTNTSFNATLLGFPLSTDGTPINASNGNILVFSTTAAQDTANAVWASANANSLIPQIYSAAQLAAALAAIA